MESNESLTSYLKSMFVQFHGEEQLPAAEAASSSQSRRASERASIKSMTVEEHSSSSELENITSLKLSEIVPTSAASPPAALTSDETDINNNDKESPVKDSTTSSALKSNGKSTIEVDVDVHHSAHNNGSIDGISSEESTVVHDEGEQPTQTTLAHHKIALTFLDELKQSLQVNDGKSAVEEESVIAKESTDTTAEETTEGSLGGVQEEVSGTSSSAASPVESGGSSVRDDEASTTTESGIGQEDLEEQWASSGQHSSAGSSSSPTTESSSPNRLVRSASSTLFSSSNGLSNGGRRVVLRSISQDVRFKLESIKEEKKVTKSHVSELANFWKGKMISPKDT